MKTKWTRFNHLVGTVLLLFVIVYAIQCNSKKRFIKNKVAPKDAIVNIEPQVSLYEANMIHLKYSEGLRLNSYYCPAGVRTVGWGATKTGKYKVSYTEANDLIFKEYQRIYNKLSEKYPHLTRQKLLALSCFKYNTNIGPQLHKALKNDDDEKVAMMMHKYVYADGKYMLGLANRRLREVTLYLGTMEQIKMQTDILRPKVQKKISDELIKHTKNG